MHVCAINSSLRGSRGASAILLVALGAGIEQAGGTFQTIHLAEKKIESCRACNHCQKSGTFRCIFEERDDVGQVFTDMEKADLLVYSSPVYVFGLSNLFKRLIERIYCRAPIEGAVLTKSGLFFHATDRALTGKPFVSLVVCDNMEDLTVRNTRDFFRIFQRFMDVPQVGRLERRSAAAWLRALDSGEERTRARARDVLAGCARAGTELVTKGRISARVQKMVRRPFVHVPLLVRLARHIPFLRPSIEAEMRRRAGVMMGPG